jgi:hypothetical protein
MNVVSIYRIEELNLDSMYSGYCPDQITDTKTDLPTYCDCHESSTAQCFDNIDSLGCSHLKKDKKRGKAWKKAKGNVLDVKQKSLYARKSKGLIWVF